MEEITTPSNPESLVQLPWAQEVFLCPDKLLRWIKNSDNSWTRDYHGEADWQKMASYVGQTYEDVAKQELDYALSKQNA